MSSTDFGTWLRRAGFALAGVLALVLAGCGSLERSAELETLAQPQKEVPYHFAFEDFHDCRRFGYDVQFVYKGEVAGTVTTFFDRDGSPTRVHIRERFFGTLTNLATGYTLTDGPDAYQWFLDLEDGTESVVGLYFTLRGPDGKKVAAEVGKVVYSPEGAVLKAAGQHDLIALGGLVCPLLDH